MQNGGTVRTSVWHRWIGPFRQNNPNQLLYYKGGTLTGCRLLFWPAGQTNTGTPEARHDTYIAMMRAEGRNIVAMDGCDPGRGRMLFIHTFAINMQRRCRCFSRCLMYKYAMPPASRPRYAGYSEKFRSDFLYFAFQQWGIGEVFFQGGFKSWSVIGNHGVHQFMHDNKVD